MFWWHDVSHESNRPVHVEATNFFSTLYQHHERSTWCTYYATIKTTIHMSGCNWPHIAYKKIAPKIALCVVFYIAHWKLISAEQLMDLNAQTCLPFEHEHLCPQNKEQCPSRTSQACDVSSITLEFLPCLTAPSRHVADPQRSLLPSLYGQVVAVMHVGPSLSYTTPADHSGVNMQSTLQTCWPWWSHHVAFWQQESWTMHSTAAFLAHLHFAAVTDLYSCSKRMCSHDGCRCSPEPCAMQA